MLCDVCQTWSQEYLKGGKLHIDKCTCLELIFLLCWVPAFFTAFTMGHTTSPTLRWLLPLCFMAEVLLVAYAQPIYPTPPPPTMLAAGMQNDILLTGLTDNYAYIVMKLQWLPDGRILYCTRNCSFFITPEVYPLTPTWLFNVATCQSPGEIG